VDQVSRGFRDGLRRELPRWRQDGLVTDEAAAALGERYGLGKPEAGGPSIMAVYVLAALLVGGGVVSLVAWHWEEMARATKLVLILGAMLAAHGAGWWLRDGGRHERIGHALQVVGTLIFGANIALVAQIFQVSGTWYGAFGGFAAGALVAGVAFESLPILLLSSSAGLFAFATGYASDAPVPGIAVAFGGAVLFVLLAWRQRSRALLLVTAAGLGSALLAATAHHHVSVFPILAVGAALAALPLAARDETGIYLAGAARPFGRIAFCFAAWILSFADAARELRLHGGAGRPFAMAVLPLVAIAGTLLAVGLKRREVDPLARGEAMLLVASLPALWFGLSLESGHGAAVVANLAIAYLGMGRVVRGLSLLRRDAFWEGVLLLALLIVSRFFEIESKLWLKGAAFIACGVAMTVAGMVFERRLARSKEVGHAA
jgi:uncharacterized membrane protein